LVRADMRCWTAVCLIGAQGEGESCIDAASPDSGPSYQAHKRDECCQDEYDLWMWNDVLQFCAAECQQGSTYNKEIDYCEIIPSTVPPPPPPAPVRTVPTPPTTTTPDCGNGVFDPVADSICTCPDGEAFDEHLLTCYEVASYTAPMIMLGSVLCFSSLVVVCGCCVCRLFSHKGPVHRDAGPPMMIPQPMDPPSSSPVPVMSMRAPRPPPSWAGPLMSMRPPERPPISRPVMSMRPPRPPPSWPGSMKSMRRPWPG